MKTLRSITFFITVFLSTHNIHGQSDSIYLWSNTVPGENKPKSKPVVNTVDDGSIRVIEVTDPFLAIFDPKAKKNGKAIVICPGGAYVRLAVHKEGYAVAEWLMQLGYTVFVLQYRVPEKRDGALQDLQRALRIVRATANRYGIDAAQVAAMGFSAGAHLVTRAGLIDAWPSYAHQDDVDKFSARPDRMILIYPAYLADGPNRSLTPDLKPTMTAVDTFIFQTMDDRSAPSAFALAIALRNANANVELHMLPEGGHGYGITGGNKAAEAWPKLLETWLAGHF